MARRRRGTRRTVTRARRRRTARLNIDSIVSTVAATLYPRLGLDMLGLTLEDCEAILKPIVEAIVASYSSRPSTASIVNKILVHEEHLYMYIAAYILEKREHYTPEQLSFIAAYGRQVICRHISRLYEEAVRAGLSDVISQLRASWMKYCSPLPPYPCPRCGFQAVVPDLHCVVCGHELTEKEFKEAVDFLEQLKLFIDNASRTELMEVRDRRAVLLTPQGIKPPSAPRSPMDVEVRLSPDEVRLVEEALRRRADQEDKER